MADVPSFSDFLKQRAAPSPAETPAPTQTPAPEATTAVPSFSDFAKNQTKTESEPEKIPNGEVAGRFMRNLPESTLRILKQVMEGEDEGGKQMAALMHDPVGQLKLLKDAAVKAFPNLPGHLMNFGAEMAQNFINRYGKGDMKAGEKPAYDWEQTKRTLTSDAAGSLLDALNFVPGIGFEKAADALASSKLAKLAVKPLATASEVLHGVDPDAFTKMVESGKIGDIDAYNALRKGMDPEKVAAEMDKSVSKLIGDRSTRYDEVMKEVKGHDKVLNFDKIDKAVGDAGQIRTYSPPQMGPFSPSNPPITAMIEKDPGVLDMRAKIAAEVEKWRNYGPAFHSAYALDKLKQAIYSLAGDAVDARGLPTPAGAYANKIAGAIKDTIAKEAPEYGKAMENWQNDTNFLKGFMSEFKAGEGNKARQLQQLKSLQQVYRNTAGVGHGLKREMLEKALPDSSRLMGQLAGDQYHTVVPRGLGRHFGATGAATALMMGHPLGAALGALAMSPRLAGHVGYGIGQFLRDVPGMAAQIPNAARAASVENNQLPMRKGGFFETSVPAAPPRDRLRRRHK